ncbi:MAG: tRNA (adenosine(37)-N6)-dimethylallyltransferase MiaA [Patescibacteria group bacterium]|jgi:tRNA dimethylallyltransferase|nr:tRNA (adenosine(37)-N6)-dimethylallyltransferase MiaA [Patescibacteria group bacterium]HPL01740.1 tRNA (adenosine(37)-N6)-dimethylallyltransferase MiaA [bacterium]
MKKERKIICIIGPTASGKTGWGVSVARKFNGEIISADSRQVYRGLDIGTGKDLEDYSDVKYHLIDICEPGVYFTVFDWLERAREVIEDIFTRGKTPIIVGGTGLYVQALIEGFELKFESQKSKVKRYRREELESKSLEELQKIIFKLKIVNSKLDMNNPHRIIRAIEKVQSGEIANKKKPDFQALQIAIDLPRDVLYDRIDQRVEERFEQGMLEEVKSLIASGVDKKWLLGLGLEYRIIGRYVLGESSQSFDKMKQELKYKIHAFARRQLTWFRRFPEIVWCNDLKSAEEEIKNFLL